MSGDRRALWRISQGFVTASLLAVASACASNRPYHEHHEHEMRDANGDVVNENRDDAGRYAHRAPPADRSETPPPQPGSNYVWVPGHWSWDGNDFQWHNGSWVAPPSGYHQWMQGHWQQTGPNNWVYVEGQWQ